MAILEAYHSIRARLITVSKIIGVEVWTSDNIFQPASYYGMTLLIIYNICNTYTLVVHATDAVKLMQIMILFGIVIQLAFKFFYQISKKHAIREIFDLVEENIYRHYSSATTEENLIIKKTVRYLDIGWKAMAVIYPSTFFIFGLWPVYLYYTKGQLVPLFMYEIPMVDTETSIGYLFTFMFQVNLYLLGVFSALMAEYMFVFFVFHAIACVDLFILHVSYLKCLLTAETTEKELIEIADKWKCCIQDHQFVTGFLNAIEDYSGLPCLVQVFTCVFTICDGMLLVALTDWYAVYGFLIVVFGVFAFYFIIGHLIELKVDAMYEAITDFPWNLLSVSQQKEYRFLLERSQRPLTLTLYGFAPLNLDSYATVLKSLYQGFIMVSQYME